MFILHMHIFHIAFYAPNKFLREIEHLMLMKKKMAGDGHGKQAVLCKVVHPVLCRFQRRLL